MKLKYITPPLNEGGAAVDGVGTIHRDEIKATLLKLSSDLDLPFDLNDSVIGSTGKRDYSGDIDIVISNDFWTSSPGAFRNKLNGIFGDPATARNGAMVHLKYPIVGYNASLQECLPRTGFVQVDFNFGNPKWEKFYHFSPGEESEYKGAHRNLAISAISSVTALIENYNTDSQNRHLSVVRWKFGTNGFILVRRVSARDPRSGNWMNKQIDTVIDDPVFDAVQIAKQLFVTPLATSDDLFSLETIILAVKKYCGLVEQEQIYRQMAFNFYSWKDGRNFVYPAEINKYLPKDDK